ncbi:MAG: hypothetical protein HOO95_07330, partial [Gallionella sp.]|nr:hypothetical protein [Gallionella sp.]
MKLSNKYVPLVLCLLFSTHATAGLFGNAEPTLVELTASSDNAAVFKQVFPDTAKPADFAVRKVAIAGFQVEFVTQHIAAGGSNGTNGKASSVEKTFTLKGTTDEQMSAMTEKLHQQFKDLLKQRGYEVLPEDALMSSSFKSELTNADGKPTRVDEKDSVLGSAASMGLIGRKAGDTHAGSVTVTAKGTSPSVFGLGFKLGTPPTMKLANELGVAVIQVRMQVNFMNVDAGNDGGLFGSAAHAEGTPQNMLGATGSQISVFWPDSKAAYFAVKKSIWLPNQVSDKATELTSTTGEKVGSIAKGAASVLGG